MIAKGQQLADGRDTRPTVSAAHYVGGLKAVLPAHAAHTRATAGVESTRTPSISNKSPRQRISMGNMIIKFALARVRKDVRAVAGRRCRGQSGSKAVPIRNCRKVCREKLFCLLKRDAPGGKVGTSGDPGARIVDFIAEIFDLQNHVGKNVFSQRGIGGGQMAPHLCFDDLVIFFPQVA